MDDYSQLWIEEKDLLYEYGTMVPKGGEIVEIGTAQGGSAKIFNDATAGRNIKIHSYDIAPSAEAYENLKDTGVNIYAMASTLGAENWSREGKGPVDLLFIDGSHAFKDVFDDIRTWLPHLKKGARVVFHDYDPIENGGLSHLGVKLLVDGIAQSGLLDNQIHQYRLFTGTINNPNAKISVENCLKVMENLFNEVIKLKELNLKETRVVCDDEFWILLKSCLPVDDSMRASLKEAVTVAKNVIILTRPLPELGEAIGEKRNECCLITLSDLHLCYLFGLVLQDRRDSLLDICISRRTFFEWEEILQMYEHAGFGISVDRIESFATEDSKMLSKLIAGEQVKLKILRNLLISFLGA